MGANQSAVPNTAVEHQHELESPLRRVRADSDPWGWFEDVETPRSTIPAYAENSIHSLVFSTAAMQPKTPPPDYILESSLLTQQEWYITAGQRPQQSVDERALYERKLQRNFDMSMVNYDSCPKLKENVPYEDANLKILCKSKCPFSNAVSKSYLNNPLFSSLTIQVFFVLLLISKLNTVVFPF